MPNWLKTTRQGTLRTFALAVVLEASLLGQRYNFQVYGQEQGLSNLAVLNLMQDRTGFIWVGTQNGLFRYDGHAFTAYERAHGLPASRIEALHESADGTLWVGTALGMARMQGGRLLPVKLPDKAEDVRGRSGIRSDPDGTLYITTRKGLVVGRTDGSGFHVVPNPPEVGRTDTEGLLTDRSAPGTVWFGCGGRVCLYSNGKVRSFGPAEGVPEDEWGGFLRDLDGTLWVRGLNNLARYDPASHRFTTKEGTPIASSGAPSLAMDEQGRLLIGSERGVARLTGARWDYVGAAEGLGSNEVTSIIEDHEGSVWVGLLGSGVARWQGYGEWEGWNAADGLDNDSIWSLARDKAGRLWAGSSRGLNQAVFTSGRWTWKHQPLPKTGAIRALSASPDGALWIGSDPGMLMRLDAVSGAVRMFGPADGLPQKGILHIGYDRNGRMVVSARAGLFRSTGPVAGPSASLRFEQLLPRRGENEESFFGSVVDSSGTIWAVGWNGLARIEPNQLYRYGVADGLRAKLVTYIALGLDGAVWVGYREPVGISKVTADGPKIRTQHIDHSNGLPGDKTISLGVDAIGNLWMGSDRGVNFFDGHRWQSFNRGDGLIWDDCNANALLIDPDNSVWLGTSRGISHFQPVERRAAVPPRVVITAAQLGKQSLNPDEFTSVSHLNDSLVVNFAALTYIKEPAVQFRYRLSEVSGTWVDTSMPGLNYMRLPPGKYTLEVLARDARGVWSAEPARMRFEIRLPWWQTWLFRLAGFAAMILFALLLWRHRLRRLEAERIHLERAVMDRTRELSRAKARAEQEKLRVEEQNREIERLLEEAQQASRLKSEFLANMSHEIRTPMNGVLGMTDLVLATDLSNDQREHLQAARSSAGSLLALLNDILDFSKVEAGRMELDPVEFSVEETVTAACKTLSVRAAEKRLQLSCVLQKDLPRTLVGDPIRVHQVLLNLIGNAIKFTQQGSVRVIVEREPELPQLVLHFRVIDTGIGIPREKQKLIFDAFRQADGSTTRKYGGTGLGLAICLRLVELMNGRIWVESEIGQGSTFHFTAQFDLPRPDSPQQTHRERDLRSLLESVQPRENTGYRVLLAEDNVVNQVLATRLLERRGHTVRIANNGREAVDLHQRERFDVVLMDVQMPEMDGLEATSVIRDRERSGVPYTPIIAMTAHAMKGDREMCLASGMNAYINKPLDAVTFIDTVESMAGAAAAAAQN